LAEFNLGGASVLLIFAALLFSSQLALAQFTQQGPKLVGTGVVGTVGTVVEQGYSVSLSSDGNTAVVGGFYDNSRRGSTPAAAVSGPSKAASLSASARSEAPTTE
jgi:hypothetical protein